MGDSGKTSLDLQVTPTASLSAAVSGEILALCNLAYGEDLTQYFADIGPGTHVLGYAGSTVVSHAMWVTRWLQPGAHPPRCSAYVELVATHPEFQRRGFASQVLSRLVSEIPDRYEMAALAPATPGIYQRLGWQWWQGPLSIRTPDGGCLPTPDDERIMVLPLPGRAPLDLESPLSAEWRPGELW